MIGHCQAADSAAAVPPSASYPPGPRRLLRFRRTLCSARPQCFPKNNMSRRSHYQLPLPRRSFT